MDRGADSSSVEFREIQRLLVALAGSDTHAFDDALLTCTADRDLHRPSLIAGVVHLEEGLISKRCGRHGPDLKGSDAYIRRTLENRYRSRVRRNPHRRHAISDENDTRF